MESVGETLKTSREEKGISRDAIADGITAKLHIIEAIEEDRILDIVAHTYAKGYIRAFCNFIGIDSEPVIEQFNIEYASSTAQEIQPPINILHKRTRTGSVNWIKIFSVVIVIIAATYLTFKYWGFWEAEEATVPETTEAVTEDKTGFVESTSVVSHAEALSMWVEAKDDANITRIYRDGVFFGDERVGKGGRSSSISGEKELVFEIDNGAAVVVKSFSGDFEGLPEGKVRVTLTQAGLSWESLEEKGPALDTSSDTP
jgi:Helix-turn-helix domain